jgi:hypothetical protein
MLGRIFFRKTGAHFSGKCSQIRAIARRHGMLAAVQPAGRGADGNFAKL